MRFMQADPIGHSGGMNLYAYVGGDPVNFGDPWGLSKDVIVVMGAAPDCDVNCRVARRWRALRDSVLRENYATLNRVSLESVEKSITQGEHQPSNSCPKVSISEGQSPTSHAFASLDGAVAAVAEAAREFTARTGSEVAGRIYFRHGGYVHGPLAIGLPGGGSVRPPEVTDMRNFSATWHSQPSGSTHANRFSLRDQNALRGDFYQLNRTASLSEYVVGPDRIGALTLPGSRLGGFPRGGRTVMETCP
ncbi:RHS repeat-associated core domain-containing protein [Maricaulaceae bacterium MS644]